MFSRPTHILSHDIEFCSLIWCLKLYYIYPLIYICNTSKLWWRISSQTKFSSNIFSLFSDSHLSLFCVPALVVLRIKKKQIWNLKFFHFIPLQNWFCTFKFSFICCMCCLIFGIYTFHLSPGTFLKLLIFWIEQKTGEWYVDTAPTVSVI